MFTSHLPRLCTTCRKSVLCGTRSLPNSSLFQNQRLLSQFLAMIDTGSCRLNCSFDFWIRKADLSTPFFQPSRSPTSCCSASSWWQCTERVLIRCWIIWNPSCLLRDARVRGGWWKNRSEWGYPGWVSGQKCRRKCKWEGMIFWIWILLELVRSRGVFGEQRVFFFRTILW